MSRNDNEHSRDFWNKVAGDWEIQVGETGDENRRLNSDPVLWAMAGDVEGLDVLDAGCGTGYLSRQLRDKGARVVGVDVAEDMVAIASRHAPDMDLRVDSCADLATVADASMDVVVSNYVLMDTADLEGTLNAFARVLRDDGVAVAIFSHPCFPQGRSTDESGLGVVYRWDWSYFERTKRVDAPWAHFKEDFIWYHRPLSDYWKAFRAAGFDVEDFEEPRVSEENMHRAEKPEKYRSRPYSAAFKLRKRPGRAK